MARHRTPDITANYPELQWMDLDASDLNTKRCEVEAFIRLHGITVQEACDLVCLDPSEYPKNFEPSPQSLIEYLPTPQMILEECAKFQLAWNETTAMERRGCNSTGERLGKAAETIPIMPQEC